LVAGRPPHRVSKSLFLPGHDYYSYESVDLASDKTVAQVRSSWMNSAAALPDGRVLFLQWDTADFTSSRQLWEVQTNLATGAFVGTLRAGARAADHERRDAPGLLGSGCRKVQKVSQ